MDVDTTSAATVSNAAGVNSIPTVQHTPPSGAAAARKVPSKGQDFRHAKERTKRPPPPYAEQPSALPKRRRRGRASARSPRTHGLAGTHPTVNLTNPTPRAISMNLVVQTVPVMVEEAKKVSSRRSRCIWPVLT